MGLHCIGMRKTQKIAPRGDGLNEYGMCNTCGRFPGEPGLSVATCMTCGSE